MVIRDAEPYALEQPTSVSGTYDAETGAITAGTLSTPQVNIRRDITAPIAASVFIDADFSLVTPNSLTGTLDSEGNLTLVTSLAVHLDVDVQEPGGGLTIFAASCDAAPVNLTFETVTPYVGGEVTVTDPNFSVPEMDVDPACDSLVSGEINNQLAGPGHSLTLTLAGDIPLPPPPGCDTSTTMVAAPAGTATLGEPVELTATVTPDAVDPECVQADDDGLIPGGFLEFFDGTTSLGKEPVQPDGTATLSTPAIQAGSRILTAAYGRATPFNPSRSDGLAYQVTANPAITSDLPEFLTIDAAPTEFDVNVTNTGFGADITHGRLDITIRRVGADLKPERVTLEYLDDTDTWVTVPLTPQMAAPAYSPVLWGSIGATTGFPLPIGEQVSQRLRIQFLPTGGPFSNACNSDDETCSGPVDVTFELIGVDGDGSPAAVAAPAPDALAGSTGRVMVVEAVRRAATIVLNTSGGPVRPHTVRQGATMTVPSVRVEPAIADVRPSGFLSYKLDDVPIAVRRRTIPPDGAALERVLITGTTTVSFDLPASIPVGTHRVTVFYSGDARFLPAQASGTFTVLEAVSGATLYDCLAPGFINARYRAFVDSFANLPAVRPADSEVDLGSFELRMRFSRDNEGQNSRAKLGSQNGTNPVGEGEGELLGIDFTFGPGGAGTAESITRVNGNNLPTSPNPALVANVDETMTFNTPTGTVLMDAAPGSVVPVTLDKIEISAIDGGLNAPATATCTPVGAPILLGEILASGNTLTVAPGGPIREGDEVTLTSAIEPYTTGQVEFRDGDETVGVANVVDGVARATTTSLPAGIRSLTAIYTGAVLAPPLVSNAVTVEVVPIECAPFAEGGHGAVVRLVYLELLGRCPDEAGYDHWVARLAGGMPSETFARTIARTPEAVGRVVDDAYDTMLGRAPDASGRAFWVSRLQAHGRYDHLLADLASSEEFWDLAGETDEGFVTRVYDRLLGRTPDPAGLDHWTDRLAAGESRRTLVLVLANLDEPLGRIVTLSYEEILDRTPSPTERSNGIDHLRSTGDRSGLYAELIGTSEFSTRAQEFPNN